MIRKSCVFQYFYLFSLSHSPISSSLPPSLSSLALSHRIGVGFYINWCRKCLENFAFSFRMKTICQFIRANWMESSAFRRIEFGGIDCTNSVDQLLTVEWMSNEYALGHIHQMKCNGNLIIVDCDLWTSSACVCARANVLCVTNILNMIYWSWESESIPFHL